MRELSAAAGHRVGRHAGDERLGGAPVMREALPANAWGETWFARADLDPNKFMGQLLCALLLSLPAGLPRRPTAVSLLVPSAPPSFSLSLSVFAFLSISLSLSVSMFSVFVCRTRHVLHSRPARCMLCHELDKN